MWSTCRSDVRSGRGLRAQACERSRSVTLRAKPAVAVDVAACSGRVKGVGSRSAGTATAFPAATAREEVDVGCIDRDDANLVRLADAIAARVGPQRFSVWFDNSTRLELRNDSLEITVADDFVREWIDQRFAAQIQDAAAEVFGGPLTLRYHVQPERFNRRHAPRGTGDDAPTSSHGDGRAAPAEHHPAWPRLPRPDAFDRPLPPPPAPALPDAPAARPRPPAVAPVASCPVADARGASVPVRTSVRPSPAPVMRSVPPSNGTGRTPAAPLAGMVSAAQTPAATPLMRARGDAALCSGASPATALTPAFSNRPRLRHDLESYVVGPSNQLAFSAAVHVAQFPGAQYNPLFIHGGCGLGKTHLLQGLCNRFHHLHPTKRWLYLTGEEFTNDFVTALKSGKVEAFRRRIREVDLLVIDDVHFFAGKKGTQEEFLHTFNAIEAMGRQVVMASDSHPREIAEFGESLVNRFVSGMVVRIDAPTFAMRCDILRRLAERQRLRLSDEVVAWVARRVTQNVRELEGALNRIAAVVNLGIATAANASAADAVALPSAGEVVSLAVAQQALGELDRMMVAPVRPEHVIQTVAGYFGIDARELMSGKRHHAVSLARSVAMYLIRKTAHLSFPEIGAKLGNRNHSTVISACRRVEAAIASNETLHWTGQFGPRSEEAAELVQRLEEQARAVA